MNTLEEQWIGNLKAFLSSRLVTPSYATASAAVPDVSAPPLLANSQGLLDGLLWSLNDSPSWSKSAWFAVQGHVKATFENMQNTNETLGKGLVAGAPLKAVRERSYRFRAAVQDVYLSFCIVDTMLKSDCALTDKKFRESIETALPQFVADYFPLFFPNKSVFLREAVEEYQWLFWDLLRCWVQDSTRTRDGNHRIEFYLAHSLKRRREEKKSGEGDPDANVASGLASLFSHSFGSGVSATLSTSITAETIGKTIRSYLNYIFAARRANAFRQRCQHCGAPFDSETAKNNHYRYHFHAHNYLRSEKVVRLLHMSKEEFLNHAGDFDKSGYFPRATESFEEAYKGGSSGVMKARRRLESS